MACLGSFLSLCSHITIYIETPVCWPVPLGTPLASEDPLVSWDALHKPQSKLDSRLAGIRFSLGPDDRISTDESLYEPRNLQQTSLK